MTTAFLGLGSNLGERESHIREALCRLDEHQGIRVERVSSLYETAPVGYTDQPDFLNAVAEVRTELGPRDLLETVLGIEKEMGRTRNLRWGPRVIDIDLLLFGDSAIDAPDLVIPHPRMADRAFAMAPLAEIAPDLMLPDGRMVVEALEELGDQRIRRLTGVD